MFSSPIVFSTSLNGAHPGVEDQHLQASGCGVLGSNPGFEEFELAEERYEALGGLHDAVAPTRPDRLDPPKSDQVDSRFRRSAWRR
jgi:hypothetical protein